MTSQAFTLETLFEPLTPEQFFEAHWERQHWWLARGQPDYYERLIRVRDLEDFISHSGLRYPAIQLAKGGGYYPPEAYTRDLKFGDQTFHGVPDLQRIAAEYRGGATLTLPAMHRSWRPLGVLCSHIEARLDHAVHANVYLTPANAAGFTPHYDVHEVLVLQVAGRKTWSIYPPPVALPHRTQGFSPEGYQAPAPMAQLELVAGDLLYLPRGYVHSTTTSDSYSIHVTIGIAVYTWVDLVREALQACVANADLRRALPPGFASRGELKALLSDKLRDVLAGLGSAVDAQQCVDAFTQRVRSGRARRPDAFRADVTVIGLDTLLQTPAQHLYRLSREAEQSMLEFNAHRYALPEAVVSTVQAMVQQRRFRTSSLPADLDAEARLTLTRYLYDIGFLTQSPA